VYLCIGFARSKVIGDWEQFLTTVYYKKFDVSQFRHYHLHSKAVSYLVFQIATKKPLDGRDYSASILLSNIKNIQNICFLLHS